MNALALPDGLSYVALIFVLFVVPRALQRWRIPAALTSLALGMSAAMLLPAVREDHTISLLSTLGISALFLLAGLDVDLAVVRRHGRTLAWHLIVMAVLLVLATMLAVRLLGIETRAAVLVALALLTPSTGFILDSLAVLGLDAEACDWVRSKAVGFELLALLVLFVTLQSTTWTQLGISVAVLLAMIFALPFVFRLFARIVTPYAPRSEFAFLMMLAVVCASITHALGVYYLVGAFVAGMTAQRFRDEWPDMGSERILDAVALFASFFVPFYFFHAGSELDPHDFSLLSLGAAAILIVTVTPVRIGAPLLVRHWLLEERLHESARVVVALLPTLVFGLVVATLLRERFTTPPWLFGALVLNTLVVTALPAFLLRGKRTAAAPIAPPPLEGSPASD